MFSKIIINSPWYFFLISILIASGIAAALYFRNRKNTDASRPVLIGMFVLRFLSTGLIILLLLNLFFKRLQNETENPVILLAIDNSGSMVNGSDSAFVKNEFLKSLTTLNQNREGKYTVRQMLFGASVKAGTEADFKEKETDIDLLMREVDNNYSNQNIGALVIASDGIYNRGASPVYASEKLNFPIYAIAMGDTAEKKDVLIQKINHNEIVYSGNNFPVEVIVNARLFKGKEINVSIAQNGTVKTSQTVKITSDNFLVPCSFSLAAGTPGIIRYTAKVSVSEGEKNMGNNTQGFVIEVIDNREKVLLLANVPHPDISAIKDAIASSSPYEVEYALVSEFKKPLKAYSLIILHGYTTAHSVLLKECRDGGIPLWIINPQITEQLPGIRISGSLNKFNDSEPYLNPTFGLFNTSEEFKKLAKNLPAVKTFFWQLHFIK